MSAFIDFGALKKYIMQKTGELAIGMGYVEDNDPASNKLSKKGQAVVKFLQDHTVDGFYREMAELLEVIMGEPILVKVKQKPGDYPGAAVVPLNRKNSSSYVTAEAFIVATMEQGITSNGEFGNKYNDKKEDLRPAVEGEIDAFLEKLKASKNLSNLFKLL